MGATPGVRGVPGLVRAESSATVVCASSRPWPMTMTTTPAMDSRQGSSLQWCSCGPTNTTGRPASGMRPGVRVVALAVAGGLDQAQDI